MADRTGVLSASEESSGLPRDFDWWSTLTDPGYLANPYPTLGRLREMAPVHHDPVSDIYFVLGYREFARMATAPEMGRDTRLWKKGWNTEENRRTDPVSYRLLREFHEQMVNADPPDHRRQRIVYERAFLPSSLVGYETMIERECRLLAESLPVTEPFDFMTRFANHLPLRVSRNLFELGSDVDGRLAEWNSSLIYIGDIMMTPEHKKCALEALLELKRFLRSYLESRRGDRSEGVIGCTIRALEEETMSEEECLNNLVSLFSGNETTVSLLGNGMLSLLRHPEVMRRLRGQPDRIPDAVEETLRYEPSIHFILRVAIEDYDLGGVVIPQGALAVGLLGAINRDPVRFDNPDAFDIDRKPNPHSTFGAGPHICIGKSLARLEARVCFRVLLEMYSEISLAGDPVWWVDRSNQHGLQKLPVLFRR